MAADNGNKPLKFIRWPEVERRIGLCRMQVDRLEKAGKFPKRVQIGMNSVGWVEHEIDDWIADAMSRRGEGYARVVQVRPGAVSRKQFTDWLEERGIPANNTLKLTRDAGLTSGGIEEGRSRKYANPLTPDEVAAFIAVIALYNARGGVHETIDLVRTDGSYIDVVKDALSRRDGFSFQHDVGGMVKTIAFSKQLVADIAELTGYPIHDGKPNEALKELYQKGKALRDG